MNMTRRQRTDVWPKVAAVKEATDHAEERGKAVDKDFNKYAPRRSKSHVRLV